MDIKTLIEKKRYSVADKDYIRQLCKDYGIDEPTKDSCSNCWRDCCIVIASRMKNDTKRGNTLKGAAGAEGVIFKGRFVSNAVMTDELAQWLRDNGFPSKLWEEAL